MFVLDVLRTFRYKSSMLYRIAVGMQKGGTGKTTTAVSLADALRRYHDYRVLVIDLDPQASATRVLRPNDAPPPKATIVEVLSRPDITLSDAIIPAKVPNIWLIPSTIKLAMTERSLSQVTAERPQPLQVLQFRLQEEREVVEQVADLILIDCPPSLSNLALNGFAAATHLLIPVESGSQFSFDGLDDLVEAMRVVLKIQERTTGQDSPLELLGYVLTKHDGRLSVCKAVLSAMEAKYGQLVFKTTVAHSTAVQKAEMMRDLLIQFDRKAMAAISYAALAREVLERLKLPLKRGADQVLQ
jgi:chromosome partitioning protein